MSNHVRLPAERIEQLRLIAEAKGKSIAEVVGDFVRGEIAAGTIPAGVPGVEIEKSGPELIIRSKGFEAKVSLSEGREIAGLLKNGAVSEAERKQRRIEGVAGLSGVRVKRAGNGLKIVSPISGREFPLSLDVAVDVGEQIERSAK